MAGRRVQVAIIGAGPAGLLLGHLLRQAGIDAVILEARTRDYVESRIRAGVLERTTTDLMDRLDLGERMHAEGLPENGFALSDGERLIRIDVQALTGKQVMVYGQTEITKDLISAAEGRGLEILWEADAVTPHEIDGERPYLTFRRHGEEHRIDCDFIAGCDGYHGVARRSIPQSVRREVERAYPFGWLGILADVPPCHHELIYANHPRGFALASMRSKTRSRYYIQVPLDTPVEEWPDERLWDELAVRLGPEAAASMVRGPAIEKSVAPLRSFIAEPMRHGRLFLAGDAAHIVPPTGAKGLNLAASDVAYLSDALIDFYRGQGSDALDGYAAKALARVWKASRFSWSLTRLMHRFPDDTPFDRAMQVAELDYVAQSTAMQTAIAENYVGLPL